MGPLGRVGPLGTPFAFFFEMRPRISPVFWPNIGLYLAKVWAYFGCHAFRTHFGCISSACIAIQAASSSLLRYKSCRRCV